MEDINNAAILSNYLMFLAVLIASIVGGLKRVWKSSLTYVLWSFVVGALLFTIAEEIIYWYGTNSLVWLHNIYSLFHLVMMSFVFMRILPAKSHWIYIVTGVLLISTIIEHLVLEDLDSVVVLSKMSFFIAMGFGCLVGFYEIFVSAEDEFVFKNPAFWILAGSLIFTTGALFSVGLADRIFTFEQTAITGMWGFHNVFNALRYVFFTVSFIVLPLYLKERSATIQ